MMMPSSRPASTRAARAALVYAIGTVPRANPVVAAWRWRYELVASATFAAVWIALDTPAAAALTGGLVAAPALTACFARGRRLLAARVWCIVTAHRVRTGCAQAWIHTRSGKIPFLIWTGSRPSGERVYLWCRAGTSAADFRSACMLLAAACMAKHIEVSHHARHTHLIALDVIRREPPVEWNGRPRVQHRYAQRITNDPGPAGTGPRRLPARRAAAALGARMTHDGRSRRNFCQFLSAICSARRLPSWSY
jgi:hypothetical protein